MNTQTHQNSEDKWALPGAIFAGLLAGISYSSLPIALSKSMMLAVSIFGMLLAGVVICYMSFRMTKWYITAVLGSFLTGGGGVVFYVRYTSSDPGTEFTSFFLTVIGLILITTGIAAKIMKGNQDRILWEHQYHIIGYIFTGIAVPCLIRGVVGFLNQTPFLTNLAYLIIGSILIYPWLHYRQLENLRQILSGLGGSITGFFGHLAFGSVMMHYDDITTVLFFLAASLFGAILFLVGLSIWPYGNRK